MIEIINIIKGDIYQNVSIEKKEGLLKKALCKVEFKCFFQEIWDFKLTFQDWGAANLDILFPEIFKSQKNFSPKLVCKFREKGKGSIDSNGADNSQYII